MKRQYLSIVLRNQFNLFYRFGYTFIPESQLIEFDGNINNKIKKSIIEQFTRVTPFEYDEEYLILHLEIEPTDKSDFIQFDIQNIISIYPLSRQAKVSIESKIDQRIQLAEPIFETILHKITTEIRKKEAKKAISALWKICKIEKPVEEYEVKIGLENIFKGLDDRNCGIPANKIQNGNYWEYLIAYDRYGYFPKSTLGYFYDAGQVFAYSKGQPTFEGSKIHKFLEQQKSADSAIKMLDIIKHLEEKEQLSYVSQTSINGIKQYIVAPLYLMLRDEIRKLDDISQTKLFKNLDYLKKFEDSFNYVIILLGAFFGFRKFYDNYYETLNLHFYKNFKVPKEKTEQQKEVETISKSNKPVIERNQEKETISGENKNSNKKTEKQSEKKQFNANIEKSNTNSNIKQNNHTSDNTDLCKKYIEKVLEKKDEVKLSEIAKCIKDETKKTVKIKDIKEAAEQMDKSIFRIAKKGQTMYIYKQGSRLF